MTTDAPDNANVLVTCSGQKPPGCLIASAVFYGYSGCQQPCSPSPTFSHRTAFPLSCPQPKLKTH